MNILFRLVSEGDSVSSSTNPPSHVWQLGGLSAAQIPGGTSFASFSPQIFSFPAGEILCLNRAVAGSRLNTNAPTASSPGDLVFRAGNWVDALINANEPPNQPQRKYIFTVMIGTNPDTTDPARAAANLQLYLRSRVAVGFSGIVVGTLLSRGDNIIGDFESYRHDYNAILRTRAWQNDIGVPAFALADFGNEPTIGAPGACNDSTLFSDAVHPTALGYSYMAPLYAAAVNLVKTIISVAGGPAPALVIDRSAANPTIIFNGTLEESDDLLQWNEVTPQPASPFEVIPDDRRSKFFRAVGQ